MAVSKIGDVVRLKSGGPSMTAGKPTGNAGTSWYYWFVGAPGSRELRTAELPFECVEPAKPDAEATAQS
jgi:uncharacterized protein YodC (DUF2158 family)